MSDDKAGKLWAVSAFGGVLYIIPQFLFLLDAHERTKPVAEFIFGLLGIYLKFFSSLTNATDGEKIGACAFVTLAIFAFAIYGLRQSHGLTSMIIVAVVCTAAWQYGRPFAQHHVIPYVRETLVPYMTPRIEHGLTMLSKAWVTLRGVPDDVWSQAIAGLIAAALGCMACKWVFGGSENLGIILLALTVAFLEAISSGCQRLRLVDKESVDGFFLYLTTLFLSGFAVTHRLMQLGKRVRWIGARLAPKETVEWPPSIYRLRDYRRSDNVTSFPNNKYKKAA